MQDHESQLSEAQFEELREEMERSLLSLVTKVERRLQRMEALLAQGRLAHVATVEDLFFELPL